MLMFGFAHYSGTKMLSDNYKCLDLAIRSSPPNEFHYSLVDNSALDHYNIYCNNSCFTTRTHSDFMSTMINDSGRNNTSNFLFLLEIFGMIYSAQKFSPFINLLELTFSFLFIQYFSPPFCISLSVAVFLGN